MIPISVSFASRWGSYEGAKLQKDQLCVGVSGSGPTLLKHRDITVGSGMFAQVWRRVGQATDRLRLNKKSLSPARLYITMKAKLLETMKEIPLHI